MNLSDNPVDMLLDSSHGKPKLLVVDDQAINIQVMHQVFGGDYQVFMATSGAQALALCKTNPPDLVLLDIVMPGMDGFEVCTQLKADEATDNIPVIFVTAHTDPAQETHGLSLGAVDFIAKPVNPAVVRARVKTHLTLKFQSDLLRKLVFLDGLTGVFNRRYFDQQLPVEWARAARSFSPLSVIMIDVDYLVARYGGEEFACILPDTANDDALALAAELEHTVRDLKIPHAASSLARVVTVSVGLATRTVDSVGDALALLGLADAQLYDAKQSGRGRVCGAQLGVWSKI